MSAISEQMRKKLLSTDIVIAMYYNCSYVLVLMTEWGCDFGSLVALARTEIELKTFFPKLVYCFFPSRVENLFESSLCYSSFPYKANIPAWTPGQSQETIKHHCRGTILRNCLTSSLPGLSQFFPTQVFVFPRVGN